MAIPVEVVTTTGRIDIKSNPAGATIYLDGVDTRNITPYITTDVPQGDHTIKLTYPHYKDRQEAVTVTADETTYINWALDYAPTQTATIQPDPATGKDSYVDEYYSDLNTGNWAMLAVAGINTASDFRTYLQFDVSGLPSTAVIEWAAVGLHYYDSSDWGTAGPIGA